MLSSFRARLAAGIGCVGCLGYLMALAAFVSLTSALAPAPASKPVAQAAAPTATAVPPTTMPTAAPPLPPTAVPPTQAPALAAEAKPSDGKSPDVLLAIIQHGAEMQVSDPRVAPFTAQLDRLEAKCSEDRGKLADLTAGANKVMGDRGTKEPILNTVSGVATASEGLPSEQACADLFTAYAVTRLGGAAGATPKPAAPKPVAPAPTAAPKLAAPAVVGNCHPSYPDFCIPPRPPDLNCNSPAIGGRKRFTVLRPDVHGFDADGNGRGCES